MKKVTIIVTEMKTYQNLFLGHIINSKLNTSKLGKPEDGIDLVEKYMYNILYLYLFYSTGYINKYAIIFSTTCQCLHLKLLDVVLKPLPSSSVLVRIT